MDIMTSLSTSCYFNGKIGGCDIPSFLEVRERELDVYSRAVGKDRIIVLLECRQPDSDRVLSPAQSTFTRYVSDAILEHVRNGYTRFMFSPNGYTSRAVYKSDAPIRDAFIDTLARVDEQLDDHQSVIMYFDEFTNSPILGSIHRRAEIGYMIECECYEGHVSVPLTYVLHNSDGMAKIKRYTDYIDYIKLANVNEKKNIRAFRQFEYANETRKLQTIIDYMDNHSFNRDVIISHDYVNYRSESNTGPHNFVDWARRNFPLHKELHVS